MTKSNSTGVYYRINQKKEKIFYITYRQNGKFVREKVGSTDENITVEYCKKLRAKRTSIDRLDEDAPLNKKDIPSFDEMANAYFESIEEQSDTKNSVGRYNNHLKAKLGNLKLNEIDSETIEKLIKSKKKTISPKTGRTYAPKTLNDMINLTGAIFNYAIIKKKLKVINPIANKGVRRQAIDNGRERYLDSDEVRKLFEKLENRIGKKYVNKYILLFVKLSLSTGARLTSVLTITKADVNLKQGTIIIKNHKSNRTYTGYIHSTLKPLLEEKMKGLSPIDYVINGSPKVIARTSINKILQPIFDEMFNQGLSVDDAKRRVVIHTLRHTFASLLAINGTPIYTIKKLMDHSDINQTMRYAKLQPDAGANSVMELEI